MNQDVLFLIESKRSSMSKGQRRIADYIATEYDKAAFMTAAKMGKTVDVSESTVVRFAVSLGFEGYPEMQKAMQEMVLNRLTSVQRLEVANDRIGDHDVLSAVLQSDMDKLRRTEETLDREAFQKAVDAIVDARRVFILGVRSTAPLAQFLGYYLRYLSDSVHIVTASGAGAMFEQIVGVNADDAVIAFSFPRYSSTTVKGAQYCRSAGATVIGITDSMISPLAENCDHVLLAKSDMLSLVDSLVAPLSLVNALIVGVSQRREKELARRLGALESIWEDYNVYEKRADKA
jgi:DNA-binding MurR/RpiR family transcriptional regulator